METELHEQQMAHDVGGKVGRRSMQICGRLTSIAIEDEFWEALKEAASSLGVTAQDFVSSVAKHCPSNLSSAVRLAVLRHFRGKGATS